MSHFYGPMQDGIPVPLQLFSSGSKSKPMKNKLPNIIHSTGPSTQTDKVTHDFMLHGRMGDTGYQYHLGQYRNYKRYAHT